MATATYTPIATQTLGSAAASITFSSIPSTYTDLRVVITGITTANAGLQVQFNGDASTNYSVTTLYGTGSAAGSANGISESQIRPNKQTSTGSTIPWLFTMDVQSYAGNTNKSALFVTSTDFNGSGTIEPAVGLWRSTSAITSITVLASSTTFATGTIATLWGI